MKILVTGGGGYIGSVLVQSLLQKNFEVIALDNFMYKQTSLLDCCSDKKFSIVRGDVRDKKLISDILKKVDAIFPLACLTGAPACDKNPHEAKAIIVDAIKTMLELRSKSQIIVYPTTNSGYGVGQKDIFCTEDTPLKPLSLYGKLKTEAEKMLLDSGNCITLRLATAFGVSPRMRLDLLVNDFTYRALYDRFIVLFEGHFKRNYIHVRDVARAFIHCIANFETMKNKTYNVGLNDANYSKIELCELIRKQISDFYFTESKIGKDPDKRNYIVSNDKILKAGFRASISLEDGISELIKGYRIIRRNEYSNI